MASSQDLTTVIILLLTKVAQLVVVEPGLKPVHRVETNEKQEKHQLVPRVLESIKTGPRARGLHCGYFRSRWRNFEEGIL